MIKQKIFISSVQGEFQNERKQIADYIRHDALLSFCFEPYFGVRRVLMSKIQVNMVR